MYDSVIERVADEDPVRCESAGGAWQREQAEVTRARVLAVIDGDQALVSRPVRRGGGVLRAGDVAVAVVVVAVMVAFVALAQHAHAPRSAPPTGKGKPAAIQLPKPIGLYAAGVVNVGDSPQALLAHGNSLWVATPSSVVRLNLHNGATLARIPIPTNGVNAGSSPRRHHLGQPHDRPGHRDADHGRVWTRHSRVRVRLTMGRQHVHRRRQQRRVTDRSTDPQGDHRAVLGNACDRVRIAMDPN